VKSVEKEAEVQLPRGFSFSSRGCSAEWCLFPVSILILACRLQLCRLPFFLFRVLQTVLVQTQGRDKVLQYSIFSIGVLRVLQYFR
jgi:hypothetical protein